MGRTGQRREHDVIVVEDNAPLREALCSALSGPAADVRGVASLAELRSALQTRVPELVILDFELPDGDGFDVLAALEACAPAPVLVAISGVAGPDAAFRLAQAGVREYLTKPIDLEALGAAIERASRRAPDLKPHLRAAVGRLPLGRVEDLVRSTMVCEALSRRGGSRRAAARQLEVSRQLLQHMLRKLT
jgi:DNA-binding NtrC family response regulator